MTNHYHLVFKVCIKRPHRAEGEAEKSEDELIRKINKFYFEATFENPAGGGNFSFFFFLPICFIFMLYFVAFFLTFSEPLVTAKDWTHYDVEVDSPTFSCNAAPYKWYFISTSKKCRSFFLPLLFRSFFYLFFTD